jgi:hypothetical protein
MEAPVCVGDSKLVKLDGYPNNRGQLSGSPASRTKVTAMLTLYAAISSFSIITFMSLIHALSTLRRVLVARSTPWLTASSKLSSDVALNSITRATVYVAFPSMRAASLLPRL